MHPTLRKAACLILMPLAVAACSGGKAPVPATTHADTTTTTTVGGATLQTSTVALADLNSDTARRYGIDPAAQGVLLLVTVRDDAGNAIVPGDLQLTATASVLPDPPKPLALRAVQTGDMTDYLGVLETSPPASVRFQLTAVRDGSRADIGTNAELQSR